MSKSLQVEILMLFSFPYHVVLVEDVVPLDVIAFILVPGTQLHQRKVGEIMAINTN